MRKAVKTRQEKRNTSSLCLADKCSDVAVPFHSACESDVHLLLEGHLIILPVQVG